MANFRVSITLPQEVASMYGKAAERLGISRSSLLSGLLVDFSDEFAKAMNVFVPLDEGQEVDASPKRIRGASVALINGKIQELQSLISEIEELPQRDLL